MSNLVLPGLGTFFAGHRLAGVLQLVISQTGFVTAMLWTVAWLRDWIRAGAIPEQLGPRLWIALLGIALFLLAWFWSLASSLQILGDARKNKV